MVGEQDIIKLIKSIDISDPESAAVGLAKNFEEIQNKVGLIGSYLKQISGGSVADIVSAAGQWTQGARVEAAALITAVITGETSDGKIQAFFQANEPTADMAYGDYWIDTDKATPPDSTCVYRYEDEGGGSTGTLAWAANTTSAIGKVFLDTYNSVVSPSAKLVAYYQAAMPYNENIGDYWIDTDDNNQLYRAAAVGATSVGTGQWEPSRDKSQTLSAATFIVADGSTSNNVKNADYAVPVGSTSAQIAIQKAIDALPSNGGKVLLLDGTYTIDGSIEMPSNVTLQGQGINTIIKVKDGYDPTVDPLGLLINSDTTNGNTDIAILDLQIDGNKAGALHVSANIYLFGVTNSQINGVRIVNSTSQGLYLITGGQNDISNNTITGSDLRGIYIKGSADNRVIGNNVSQNGNCGIEVLSYDTTQATGNTITGNICNDNSDSGIYIHDADNTIGSNSCFGNTLNGIQCGSGSDGSTVSNNNCSQNGTHGISVSGSNVNIVGNASSANSQTTTNTSNNIYVSGDYCNIQNNKCRKGALTNRPKYGIYISSGGDYNVVTNNDLYNSGASGQLSDASGTAITAAGNRLT